MSLTVQRDSRATLTLPAGAAALLLRHYPDAASEVRATAARSSISDFVVDSVAPADVALFGQSVVDGPLEPQSVLRTSTHSWRPTDAPANTAGHVVFLGLPRQFAPITAEESVGAPLFPFQLTAPTAEAKAEQQRKADFDKKQSQLKTALESNQRAFEEAKENGELSDVGALAIERDRIGQVLAIPFQPRPVSRATDTLWLTSLSVELPLGYFKHPESGLLWKLIKAPSTKDTFKQIAPRMLVNHCSWRS